MSGPYERHGKRALDLAALASRRRSPRRCWWPPRRLLVTPGRPVLFRQARVGRDGEEFTILKFRTMSIGSEHDGDGYWGTADDRGSRRSAGCCARRR